MRTASASRILGGAAFGAAVAMVGFMFTQFSLESVLQGIVVGGIVGGYIAVSFNEVSSKLIPNVLRIGNPTATSTSDESSFWSGVRCGQLVGIFLSIPFVVLISVLFCLSMSLLSLSLGGPTAALDSLRTLTPAAFEATGAYVHSVIIAGILFWCMDVLVNRRLPRGQRRLEQERCATK